MADQGLLFGRVAEVTVIGSAGQAVTINNDYSIAYSVDYNGGKATASVTIANAPTSVKANAEGGKTISIIAGYEKYKGVIFTGDITETGSKHTTGNETLTIKAKGSSGSTKEKISISGAPGITASSIISTISAQTRHKITIDNRLIDKAYSAGFSFLGIASKAVNQIATKIGARVIEQSNGLTVLIPADDTLPPIETIILNPETGLIGYPEKIKKNGDGLRIKMLLNHKMTVGTTTRIESEMASLENNIYIAKRVTHKGSNQSGTAVTTIEAYNKGERK